MNLDTEETNNLFIEKTHESLKNIVKTNFSLRFL